MSGALRKATTVTVAPSTDKDANSGGINALANVSLLDLNQERIPLGHELDKWAMGSIMQASKWPPPDVRPEQVLNHNQLIGVSNTNFLMDLSYCKYIQQAEQGLHDWSSAKVLHKSMIPVHKMTL